MRCPKCNTEMRIKSTGYVTNGGKLYSKQIMTCRKKDCINHDLNVKSLYNALSVVEDNEAPTEVGDSTE